MENSKFLETLRTINKRELTAFAKYLDGNYSNDKIALAVFDYIRAFFPDYRDEKKLEIAYAYKKIFGADIQAHKNNRKKLLNTLSDLYKWLKEFLLCEKIKDKSLESTALWLAVAKQRGLEGESNRQLQKIRTQITASSGATVSEALLGMLADYYTYYQQHNKNLEPNVEALLNCVTNLDRYYCLVRLKLACEMASLKKLGLCNYQSDSEEFVQKMMDWPQIQDKSPFQLYKEAYLVITQDDENAFLRLEKWLYDNHDHVGKDELHIALSYLQNFAAAQFKKGNMTYSPVLHRLNLFGVEKGLFIQKNVMSATRFNNIVGIACREADFDWVHSFITEYKDYLLDEYREDTARLAQAIVLFHQKKFEAAYYLFSKTEFSSPESTIQAKLYEIRCLFELEWGHTALDSYINTFQVFLQRKRIKRTHIVVPALNFIRLLRMISEEKTPHEKIIDKINNTKPLYLKDWLLEKMELYKGKFATQKPRGN